jgi:hypothetical protein
MWCHGMLMANLKPVCSYMNSRVRKCVVLEPSGAGIDWTSALFMLPAPNLLSRIRN